tara:strand:- start:379 stop:561 length:183 start_codon:yes stop_codon:yes gene_type:complete
MKKEMLKEIPNWEKSYLDMAKSDLSKQQIELLEGRDIRSHEGMIYGQMYNDWKLRRNFNV